MDSSGSSIGGRSSSSSSRSKVPFKGEKRCKRPNGKSGQLVDLSQHDSLLCTGIYKFPLSHKCLGFLSSKEILHFTEILLDTLQKVGHTIFTHYFTNVYEAMTGKDFLLAPLTQ